MVQAISHDVASIPDDVAARFLSDMAHAEPERPRVEAALERERAYVFRTRAGTNENPRIVIPGPSMKEEMDEKLAPRLARVYARKYGADQMARYEDLRERVGSHRIKFQRIGPGKGAHYQTNDVVVANFIREQIAKGTIQGLYEDYQASSSLRSQYTNQLFPNTEAGRIELAQYDLNVERQVAAAKTAEAALDAATAPDNDAAARVASVKKV